ncbi:MAG: sporulation protein YtxC [Syntrophomonadaceae bacterium]|jgi:putative sporulation protein YtxC
MIYQIQIVTANDSEWIVEQTGRRLQWIKEKGYQLTIDIIQESDVNFITLALQGNYVDGVFRDEDIENIFKHQLAEVLAESIVNNWEPKLIWREVLRSCKRNHKDDKKIIFEKAREFIRRCNDNESLNLLMNFGRKNRIAHKILDHLNNNDRIVMEGFINFCVPDYLTEVRFAVELAMEELKDEKEYNEFVKLLRYFVDSQPPKVVEVNLSVDANGVFHLWDGKGTKIEENYMSFYLEDISVNEVNIDDVLISILITIAPRKIVLHNTENVPVNEAMKMIKNVFHDKIQTCPGCDRCFSHTGRMSLKSGVKGEKKKV